MIPWWIAAIVSAVAALIFYRIGLFVGRLRQAMRSQGAIEAIWRMGNVDTKKAHEMMGRILTEGSVNLDELRKADDT